MRSQHGDNGDTGGGPYRRSWWSRLSLVALEGEEEMWAAGPPYTAALGTRAKQGQAAPDPTRMRRAKRPWGKNQGNGDMQGDTGTRRGTRGPTGRPSTPGKPGKPCKEAR